MNNSSDLKSNQADPFSKLIHSYTTIYDQRFTFCVPNSWFEHLSGLSLQINTLLTMHPEYSIEVSDVKESYGQLKFYFSLQGPELGYELLDQQIETLIEQANHRIQSDEGAQA